MILAQEIFETRKIGDKLVVNEMVLAKFYDRTASFALFKARQAALSETENEKILDDILHFLKSNDLEWKFHAEYCCIPGISLTIAQTLCSSMAFHLDWVIYSGAETRGDIVCLLPNGDARPLNLTGPAHFHLSETTSSTPGNSHFGRDAHLSMQPKIQAFAHPDQGFPQMGLHLSMRMLACITKLHI